MFKYTDFTLPQQQLNKDIIENTNWMNVSQQNIGSKFRNGIKLRICKKRWIKECNKSIKNKDLPILPTVVNNNNDNCIEWVKIIHIQAQNVFIGLRYGYDQQQLSLIFLWLKHETTHELPQELMVLIIKFSTNIKIKSICLNPDYNNFNNNYYVNQLYIDDIFRELVFIADNKNINFHCCLLNKFFDENLIDYEYLKAHKRGDLVSLMKPYGIKAGKAAKIWKILCDLSEIK